MVHNVQKADMLIHICFVRKGRKIYVNLKANEKYFISHQQQEIMLNIFFFSNGQDHTIDLMQAKVVYFSVLIFF